MEDILETKISQDGMTLRQAGAMIFLGWVLKTVSNSGVNNNLTQELNMLSTGFFGSKMEDKTKLEIINKMKRAGVL